ncbi:PAS domain-containing methyl-accepting chemotaxis protein [Oleisolibacter albus]|uniref:methyl-accepting chemotaxis protein n=1 Tax=Oleisolibacter albus TaxID=2171757 RepID=UPI001EFC36FC|nr:PAS domain-containing methyl-accepting chemotaxis protein [Oleisolibacter albus]
MLSRFRRNDRLLAQTGMLDQLSTKVMVADADLTIVYMNPAALDLMREAEADLRKELPQFRVDTLIGSKIDVFHKTPDRQRHILVALSKPHNATITIGRRIFDIGISPVIQGGKRVGFTVEWTDARHRLQNRDFSAQIDAINRSQAVIEFTPDGTIVAANENFLKTLGYTMPEIQGKQHRMFVEAAYAASPDYTAFWDRLRAGEYQAAQFKRIGRNGKVVWIEASYNPILDDAGRVVKVVKVATDITAQVELLANLKSLIDRNFGEISSDIDRSSAEAGSAALAAGEAASNVQAVVAGVDEMAASIDEISRSMTKSRTATEAAAQRAAVAEQSTSRLTNAAQAMNGIIALIQDIAGQINLLALNATIEAARAGDAGKGFAVVASEVKNLANQAARATEQISGEIDSIQSTSTDVAGALDDIRAAITSVQELVTTTASAVEEQSAVTRGMLGNVQNASQAVSTVSANVGSISAAVGQVAGAVGKTREAAQVLVR